MPIDPSISDLTWLTQTADPAKDLAAGASVGGHIAQSRLGFASLAQRAQEFEQQQAIEKQKLGMELAQVPLRNTLLQQQAQENALKIELGLKAKQDDIEATGAFTGLADRVSPMLKTGKLDDALATYADAGLNNNVLLTDPRYQNLGKQLDAMRKEADLAIYRKGSVEARMKAASGMEFRSLPPTVKIDRLLQQAQSDLADAQDPETGDPSLVQHFQTMVTDLQNRKQMEVDKLTNQQNKVTNESDRIKAMGERTAAIQARTLELGNRLNKGDLALMNQKIKVIQDQPNSKMDFNAKMKAIDDIHTQFEAKTKTYSTPGAAAPAANAPGPEDRVYINKDGKTYWVPKGDLDKYLKGGYTLAPNAG